MTEQQDLPPPYPKEVVNQLATCKRIFNVVVKEAQERLA